MSSGYIEQDLSVGVRQAHRALASLQEELEAIDYYNQRADRLENEELKTILLHNRDEEIEHASMLFEYLRRTMPEFDSKMKRYLFTTKPVTEIEAGGTAPARDLAIAGLEAQQRLTAHAQSTLMTDILRRSLSPITEEAWKEIDLQASRTLKGNLSGRGLVDFSGPHGWTMAAVNLGSVVTGDPVHGVSWGRRDTLNLIELRAPFSLNLSDLDNVSRGGKAPDLKALIAAAHSVALLEDGAIYNGFGKAGIKGMGEASTHTPILLQPDILDAFTESVEAGVLAIQRSGIEGPYALVLGTTPYTALSVGDPKAYPLRKRIECIATGGVFWSPALQGGIVLTRRGGDFEMTVGEDLSIGYLSHDKECVELYLTESFTFRVLEPAAAVELRIQA
jgi:uncharacterized linocin/CFP29 family protein